MSKNERIICREDFTCKADWERAAYYVQNHSEMTISRQTSRLIAASGPSAVITINKVPMGKTGTWFEIVINVECADLNGCPEMDRFKARLIRYISRGNL